METPGSVKSLASDTKFSAAQQNMWRHRFERYWTTVPDKFDGGGGPDGDDEAV
jgi:hypothetical protein